MGVWDELDIGVSVELDATQLDEVINMVSSNEYFADILLDELEATKDELTKNSDELATQLAEYAKSLQQATIALNKTIASGALYDSIEIEADGERSYLVGTTINHFYPLCIEKGRGEVVPVRAKVLHFFTKTGEEVFTRKSRAFSGKPYVEPAYQKLLSDADSIANGIFG